jgi:hypothetical protein
MSNFGRLDFSCFGSPRMALAEQAVLFFLGRFVHHRRLGGGRLPPYARIGRYPTRPG